MFMEKLIESLVNTGPMGVMLGILCYFIYKQHERIAAMTDRLFEVVENNTQAFQQLKSTLDNNTEVTKKCEKVNGKE
jgi:hypothetical protein